MKTRLIYTFFFLGLLVVPVAAIAKIKHYQYADLALLAGLLLELIAVVLFIIKLFKTKKESI